MLQINTGKLFSRNVERTNRLTGVLYSNARMPHDRQIVTGAGSLRGTGSGPADLAIIYELEERIEAGPEGPGVLVSHTAGPYLDDFAVVASFGLGGVFSREPGVVRTLTDGRPGFSSSQAPEKFISRFFDRMIHLSHEDVEEFERFVADLLALERKSFLGAMQAMRTLIAGLHQISENLGQAYTMMVSSVESLAQNFDGFVPTWSDLDGRKRVPIDSALAGLDAAVADGVREAILSHEHVALGRRYRAFALSHIDDAFFRQRTKSARPVARYELEPAIKKAYDLRSAYVHQLRQLSTELTFPHAHWETVAVERRPALTFEGLYRVSREVIRSFVTAQPKIEREEYDYALERAGIIQMEMAPQYWVWQPIADPKHARRRLEGLLSLVVQVFSREPDAQLVDMRPALADVEKLLPGAAAEHRPALLSLYFLFNILVAPDQRSPGFDAFFTKHAEEAGRPSVEAIVVGTLLGAVDDWPIDAYASTLDRYFAERIRKHGLHAPRLAEAAMCLTLAEKYRQASDIGNARAQLARAFEVHPSHKELRALLDRDVPDVISWQDILLPPRQVNEGEGGELL